MPDALRIGLLGPLQVRDDTGRPVHVGGRQLRVLLTLLALNGGRVVPAGSLAAQIWPDDPPGNPGNALQTLVSRLRAELRQGGIGDVIESRPAGYRLAVPPEAVDVMAFEALAARGRRALADGDAGEAARVLRDALLAWRGQPLADAAGCDFADAAAAKLTELRASALARRLAIFPGGSTLGAAEQVCADELLPSAAVLPALSGLVDKSILGTVEGTDGFGPRYRMLETVRAYGLDRLAEADEEATVRDAFTAYYLNMAETADPRLRAAGQGRWLRELTSEQDNLHAALRWTTARQDADAALRFVRALGWYWMLRGQPGEPEALACEVLTLQPRERSARMAEARVVCALTAAGETWDIDAVRPVLAAAVADLAKSSPDGAPAHPIAAMGEPMLALYDRDPERAFAVFDRYSRSGDPWVRAATPLLRGTFGSMLGRTEGAESDCQAALAAFRALGEAWGTAAVLMQLADFAKLRGDYAAAIAALEEAASLGHELGAWGDLAHIAGKLASVRLRAGDLTGARADLQRAERGDFERSAGRSDAAVWLGLVRAELHFREGDTAAAARVCAEQLAWLEGKPSVWWHGLRAIIQARLALAVLADGDKDRCRTLLADALRTASDWVELPALADVIDAIAVLAQHPARPCRSGDPVEREERAKLAATLLGAAHAVRGCFDEGSLDASAARESVRTLLGPDTFEAGYERGRALSQDDAVTLAASTVANP